MFFNAIVARVNNSTTSRLKPDDDAELWLKIKRRHEECGAFEARQVSEARYGIEKSKQCRQE